MSGARGRPRKFDLADAVAASRAAFWHGGLAGTSIDTLTTATGLHRPSIVAAFGDKAGLYRAALDGYLDDAGRRIADALSRPRLADALTAFYLEDLALFFDDQAVGRGCFLVATGLDATQTDPTLGTKVNDSLQLIRSTLAGRIDQAVEEREIAPGHAAAIADQAYALHLVLATESRAGRSRTELHATVERFVGFIRGLGNRPQ